jgi:hypothetical protein
MGAAKSKLQIRERALLVPDPVPPGDHSTRHAAEPIPNTSRDVGFPCWLERDFLHMLRDRRQTSTAGITGVNRRVTLSSSGRT